MNNLQRLREIMGEIFHRIILHPLFILGFFVYVMWNTLFVLKVSDSFGQDFDSFVLLFIASVSFIAALTMIARTRMRHWTILSSGLLGFLLATTVLYGQATYIHFYGIFPYAKNVVDAARSLYTIGSILMLIGLLQEWWYEQEFGQATRKEWILHPIKTFRSRRFNKEY